MKKLVSVMVTFCMVILLSSNITFADVKTDKVYLQVARLDQNVQRQIDMAVEKGDSLMNAYYQAIAANPEDTERLTAKLESDLDNLVNELVIKTNAMVLNQIPVYNKKGVSAESYYTEVQIGNRTVQVDPCRTIGY